MKTVNESENPSADVVDNYLDAQSLRDITLTKDQLFSIAKKNICDSIMGSMVDVATKQGRSFYSTNILAAMDKSLLDEIMESFKNLNYKVELSEVVSDKKTGQEYRVLTVDWRLEN